MRKHVSHAPLFGFALFLLAASGGCGSGQPRSTDGETIELLNVSYDPTRELWKEIDKRFIPEYEQKAHVKLSINQSHGGSSSQARSVIEGNKADVVTLALWTDTDAIRKAGLINDGWEDALPNGSLPYSSTIVFVVRKGNPKGIRDWSDLVKPGVEIITPNPKTSGNGKLSFLAAWGSVVTRGGSEGEARELVTKLYKQVPVLDSGARGSSNTFAEKGKGDVHLTWENEAYLEVQEHPEAGFEVIYPPVSIRAEPRVAVVDANVDARGTRAAAEAYLKFLYTDEAQEILAKNHYRPYKREVLAAASFPPIELFEIKQIARGWDDAEEKFFGAGGVFDSIYEGQSAAN